MKRVKWVKRQTSSVSQEINLSNLVTWKFRLLTNLFLLLKSQMCKSRIKAYFTLWPKMQIGVATVTSCSWSCTTLVNSGSSIITEYSYALYKLSKLCNLEILALLVASQFMYTLWLIIKWFQITHENSMYFCIIILIIIPVEFKQWILDIVQLQNMWYFHVAVINPFIYKFWKLLCGMYV